MALLIVELIASSVNLGSIIIISLRVGRSFVKFVSFCEGCDRNGDSLTGHLRTMKVAIFALGV